MRNLIAIFLLSLYSVSVLGLIINVHFCDGEAESIQVVAEVECCCIDESGTMDNCCEDKTIVLQVEDQLKHLNFASEDTQLKSWNSLHKIVIVKVVSLIDPIKESRLFLDLPPPKEKNLLIQTQKLILYS